MNGGSVDFSNLNGTVASSGAAAGWAWMLGINSCFGSIAPMLINRECLLNSCLVQELDKPESDLGRYANTPGAAVWPQFFSMLVGNQLIMILGLTSGAVTYQLFGVQVWNVWTICQLILENEPTVTWRAGIFIFSITQIYATIGTNLFANSIPFARTLPGCGLRRSTSSVASSSSWSSHGSFNLGPYSRAARRWIRQVSVLD